VNHRSTSLRDRQREAVMASILDAAEEVIAEKGVATAPIAEIAKRAGVAVGTVYNYFPDRDGLVQALLADRRAAIVPGLRAAAAAHADEPFETALHGFLRDCLTMMEERRRFVQIAFEVKPQLHPGKKDRTVISELHRAIEAILARGVHDADRVRLYTGVVAAAMKASLFDALERDVPFVSELDALVDVLLHGVRR